MSSLVPFVLPCLLAVATALMVVALRRPVHVAAALLAHSLSMAGLYLTLAAQLAAVAQILIYSGAIVVLFLIVVALLPTGGKERIGASNLAAALLVFAAVGAVLLAVLKSTALPAMTSTPPSVKEIGRPLFVAPLLTSFELTAPLLLAAIVAAIALWRRQEAPKKGGAV